MAVEIVRVKNPKELKKFICFPRRIYAEDPHWVAPLDFERKQFFNPKKNPFFKSGEAELFLALKHKEVVGRISAQFHKRHLAIHKDDTGFFGFFDSVQDPEVARVLMSTAEDWVKKKGLKKIRGPFNFTINDEVGVLVDGFDSPPFVMMTHNLPYYDALLASAGCRKVKDLFAWHYTVGGLSEGAMQLAQATREYPGLTLRSIDMKNFDSEIRLMMQIFNEAWAENWGFIPMSEEEISHVAKEMKPVIDPEMAFFAFVNGDPAAFSVSLPNINEAIHDLNGRLFPLGLPKLLWRLKKGLKSIRKCLMGIRKPYRGSALGALSVLMHVEAHRRGTLRGYKTAELSWTLEDNDRINRGIEFMGGRRYKTYRIYEKEI